MTNEERAAILGDELTSAVAAYIANPSDDTLSDFCAALINRCASMAAGAVVNLYERVEQLEASHDVE